MDPRKKAYMQTFLFICVILGFSIAAFVFSLPMPGNAPIFPRMAACALFLFSLALLIQTISHYRAGADPEQEASSWKSLKNPMGVMLLLILYAVGFRYVGFYTTSLLETIALMFYMGIRFWKTIVLVSAILMVFLYGLFTLALHVPMPYGFLM